MSNSLGYIENKKIKLWRFVNVNVNVNACENVNSLWNIGIKKKIWRVVNVNVNVKFSTKHRDCQILYET